MRSATNRTPERQACFPPRWRLARRSASLGGVLAVLGVAIAGCGGSSGSSTSTTPAASGAGGSYSEQSAASKKLEQYSQCMRSHGVPSFPDPVNGHLELQVIKGGPLDPSSPQFQSAEQACKALQPPGLQSGSSANVAQQSQILKLVNCMRKNGVPNFPDPQNGHIQITGANGIDPNSPQFQSAVQACQKLLPSGSAGGA
jgi:hypothetical protein